MATDTKLVSMKLPPRDKSAEEKMYPSMCSPGDEPEYPYGLCINLDEKQLAQLGLATLPKVGGTVTLQAKGTVSSVSENQTQDGTRRSLSVQITDLGVES